MAFKKRRRTARRRRSIGAVAAAAPRRRRASSGGKRKATRRRSSGGGNNLPMNPTNIALAIGGALLANAYVERIPIADPKMRYAAGAVGAYLLAGKVPKQFRPALIGAAVACGGKAVLAFAPNILSFAPGMGRLTTADKQRVLSAAQRHRARMGAFDHPVITGPGGQPVITGLARRNFNGHTLYG